MISARKFCQEPGYPIAIFLTYSFDPLFFERIPIDDLGVGGTRRILILGDATEIGEAMKRCAGQVFFLGRKYTLAEARATNLFHPKMILRLSPEGGRVWIGSGNLTYTGWGGNHELATTWSVGPGAEDDGTWLSDILRSVATVTNSDSFRAQLELVPASIPWIRPAASTNVPGPVLLGMPGRPLAPQLAERWAGRRFTSLKIYTGSTDVDGAFLAWANKTFGVTKATICVSPPFASFDAKQLAKLPMTIRFVERDPDRRVHAKFFWFSGTDGDAAIMGSANCSAAAWLANHDNGNVELVTVYDTPEAAAFAPILKDFDGEKRMPQEVLTAPVEPEKPPESDGVGTAYRLTSLRLRTYGRIIEALVEPAIDTDDATLVFEAKGQTFRITMKRSGERYSGRLAEDMSLGSEAVFATMEIPSGSGVVTTSSRWIDNEVALENTARDRNADPNHQVFAGRGFGGATEQRIIEAIQAISSSLLNFETPDLSTIPSEQSESDDEQPDEDADERSASPVDPSKMIYNLSDQVTKNKKTPSGTGGPHGISLQGVMRLLFATDDEPEVDLAQERWTADEPEKRGPNSQAGNNPDDTTPATRSDAEALKALREEIDGFLFELGKPKFAETCPPTILAQAIVFPILLGIKGNDEGLLPDDALAYIAYRVVQIMFSKHYGIGKPKGLFRQVQARYAAETKRPEFLQAMGDGAVYTVLLAALAKPQAQSSGALIQQADAISQVVDCTDLLALSDPDQRSTLTKNVVIRDVGFAISERALALAPAMKRLTASMLKLDRANPGRSSRSTMQRAGSVLWSVHGWEVTARSPAETYSSGLNLENVLTESADVQHALDDLWQAMKMEPKRIEADPGEPPSVTDQPASMNVAAG